MTKLIATLSVFPTPQEMECRRSVACLPAYSNIARLVRRLRSFSCAEGHEFKLPPLWKRFAAEVLDSFILLFVKLLVTYIAVDFFDIIDLDKYDFDLLREDTLNYKLALEVTSEIVVLEVIHRILVCFYETICLHKGIDSPGGRTPGKGVFGLKVVSCASIEEIGGRRIRVYPAGDIGLGWALLRSFVKNFTMAFLFPACLTIFCFQHGRAAYDVLCNCIVVEELPPQNR
ncbi:protein FAM8A1 [Dermacentor albipictus]|uniref:protein FAM8A1 n=1 Tax=Dermacentor albipictus TaxID=60249 RepID=UPI0031FE00A5